MIKRYATNKIAVTTLCLILFLMFYFFPTKNEIEEEVNITNNTKEEKVFLLDEDNYVSEVITYYEENNIEDNIRKRIDILMNGIDSLNNFYPLIPKDTKINSLKVDKDNVYIDFSTEFLSVNKYMREYMIEAIIYTLTEINGINNIYITVDNKKVDFINNPLNRSYGINKKYNINSLNNLQKTTVYFSKKSGDVEYYVPITKVSNIDSDKIDIILYELKSSINSQDNLNSYVNDNLELVSYDIKDNKMNLIFNKYIFNDDKIIESVSYIISNSIFENYDVDEVVFNTEEKHNILKITK